MPTARWRFAGRGLCPGQRRAPLPAGWTSSTRTRTRSGEHCSERYRELVWRAEFEFLLYDVTSTYFEGQAVGNEKAARGYSRDQRPDCKQSEHRPGRYAREGLPIGYEIFAGNRRRDHRRGDGRVDGEKVRPSPTHLGDGPRDDQRGQHRFPARRERATWWARPRVSSEPLKRHLLEKENWAQVQEGVEVKLVAASRTQAAQEQYVLCRSSARRQKEVAMIEGRRSETFYVAQFWTGREPPCRTGPPERREPSSAGLGAGWGAFRPPNA